METDIEEFNDKISFDSFFKGKIKVLQKVKGFRFSIDAPLLASFIKTKKGDKLIELGAGNGIISLILTHSNPLKKIVTVEIQKSLVELAKKNVEINNFGNKIKVLQADLRKLCLNEKYDVVFSNPPYRKVGEGKTNPDIEKAIARHEILCDIYDVMKVTSSLMKKNGKAYFIFRTERKDDFEDACMKNKLKIKRIKYVYPKKNSKSNLFLTEVVFFSNKIIEEEPIIIHKDDGTFTEEMQNILNGKVI
ncbi:MAG: methyltransferase [Acidobacteriota bacterium]